jgi:hypothetical protein
MQRLSRFLRQHVIALLALTLVVSGGAAFAAGSKLPKNSVASKQVKNNSLKGKDLKDRSVTGVDLRDGSVTGADLQDGSISGTDLSNGTVGRTDLADDAADEVRVVYYNGGGMKTLWEEPGVGKATFELSCSPSFSINVYAEGGLSPARSGTFGFEDHRASGEASDSAPILGAASVSRLGVVGLPSGGAGFGGSPFGFGQVTMFFMTRTMDVHIDLNVHLCSASGTITIDHKPEGSVVARPRGNRSSTVCEATGQAYCTEPAA